MTNERLISFLRDCLEQWDKAPDSVIVKGKSLFLEFDEETWELKITPIKSVKKEN